MMDPIYPWLDPVEVRRLAEGLMRPNRETAAPLSDAGFDDAFVGFATDAAPPPPAAAPPAPAAIVPPDLVPAPVIAESSIEPEDPAPDVVARGPFLDRITRFRDWMRAQFGATGVFILDREGAVIFDESKHGRLHFLARSLALASRRQRNSTGNVHVKITAGSTLEVIPVDTAYGCLVLGAVVPEALNQASVAAVMDALSKIASPPEGNG